MNVYPRDLERGYCCGMNRSMLFNLVNHSILRHTTVKLSSTLLPHFLHGNKITILKVPPQCVEIKLYTVELSENICKAKHEMDALKPQRQFMKQSPQLPSSENGHTDAEDQQHQGFFKHRGSSRTARASSTSLVKGTPIRIAQHHLGERPSNLMDIVC
jgi:hypothetical protein